MLTCIFQGTISITKQMTFVSKQGARSIQPKFRPGKVVHLKRWTSFFETFPVGPNRSIEFWTEISGNFGRMDRAQDHRQHHMHSRARVLNPQL